MTREIASGRFRRGGRNIRWAINTKGDGFVLRFKYHDEDVELDLDYGEDVSVKMQLYLAKIDRGTLELDSVLRNTKLNDSKLILQVERTVMDIGLNYDLSSTNLKKINVLLNNRAVSDDIKEDVSKLLAYLEKIGPRRLAIPEKQLDLLKNSIKNLPKEDADAIYAIYEPHILKHKKLRREILDTIAEVYDKYSDRIVIPENVKIIRPAKPMKEWFK